MNPPDHCPGCKSAGVEIIRVDVVPSGKHGVTKRASCGTRIEKFADDADDLERIDRTPECFNNEILQLKDKIEDLEAECYRLRGEVNEARQERHYRDC